MSYTQQQAIYSRVAATALLALSAGACVGVALSFSPAVSSLYAPVAVRPVVASRVASSYAPQTAAQAGRVFSADQQFAAVAEEPVVISSTSSVNMWTLLSGGVAAGLAAVAAIMYKSGKAEQSEQIAMLAVFGKKAAPAATKISKVKEARPLWYPTAEPPAWLDGSLPGDRGFDPLGLSKPTEYLQMDLDALDQNAPKNVAGDVIGRVAAEPDQVSTDALQPYSEVFGLQRFRECELIHGRWAMLAVLGVLVSEAFTGVAWQNAGLVEVQNGASYFGFSLPFTNTQVVWFEVLAMGGVEVFRNSELDLDKRCYPGGAFDPLGFTSKDEAQTFRLKEAELKHGRLAMLAFLGFAIAAAKTGLGATEAFNQWATTTFG